MGAIVHGAGRGGGTGKAVLDQAVLASLQERFGKRLSTAHSTLEQHGRGESHHAAKPPEAVVFVQSSDEVSFVLRLCNGRGIPVIAFGAGTSLEGNVSAVHGGVCIDLSTMKSVLSVNPEDLDCTVEAGVTRRQLNEYLRDSGLFFPIDPGADASLGGMVATRASGTNAVRYGTMRDVVMGLTVVLADGTIIKTGSRARKSASGYDLTRLFVGSEGTLGIVTEVTLRLFGIPEAIAAATCTFPDVDAAIRTVTTTIQFGIPVARVELLDRAQLRAVNLYSKSSYPEADTLFFEFHGGPESVREQIAQVEAIALQNGGGHFAFAHRPEERSALWRARHDALYATTSLRTDSKAWSTDVCVPISRLGECIAAAQAMVSNIDVPATIVGHVGDGNFHVIFAVDPGDQAETAMIARISGDLAKLAISLGGSATGEHGIGTGKLDYMRAEHGEAVEVMRSVKAALDPRGILNPGKVIPPVPPGAL